MGLKYFGKHFLRVMALLLILSPGLHAEDESEVPAGEGNNSSDASFDVLPPAVTFEIAFYGPRSYAVVRAINEAVMGTLSGDTELVKRILTRDEVVYGLKAHGTESDIERVIAGLNARGVQLVIRNRSKGDYPENSRGEKRIEVEIRNGFQDLKS